jgi:tight adherence protein B
MRPMWLASGLALGCVVAIMWPRSAGRRRLRTPRVQFSLDLVSVRARLIALAVRAPRRLIALSAMGAAMVAGVLGGPVAALVGMVYSALAARAVVRGVAKRRDTGARARRLDDLTALAADLRAGLPPLAAADRTGSVSRAFNPGLGALFDPRPAALFNRSVAAPAFGPSRAAPASGPTFGGPGLGPDLAGSGLGPDLAGPGLGPDFAGSGLGPDLAGSRFGPDLAGLRLGPDLAGPDLAGSGSGLDLAEPEAVLPSSGGSKRAARDEQRIVELTTAVWRLAEQTGAPAADLVDRIEADARAADRARASAAAQAAGAQATALLLAALPLGGIALGFAIGADPLQVLLHTSLGAACAGSALLLQCAGLAWADRLTNGPVR